MQIAGKYVDGDLVEKPIGTSTLFFGAIIVLLTYASIAPQFQAGEPCRSPYTALFHLQNAGSSMDCMFSAPLREPAAH